MKKTGSILLAALLLMGVLWGCGKTPGESAPASSGKSSDKTPVVLNEVAHSIFYAPMYVHSFPLLPAVHLILIQILPGNHIWLNAKIIRGESGSV